MKQMKKYIFFFVAVMVSAVIFSSCDKLECNGALDGQWQLTEWKSPTGELLADKQARIFYNFQLQMMTFQIGDKWQSSSFENTGTSLRVYDPLNYIGGGREEILPMTDLAKYGVPEDGIMKIEKLTSGTMILSSNQRGTLTFRKY